MHWKPSPAVRLLLKKNGYLWAGLEWWELKQCVSFLLSFGKALYTIAKQRKLTKNKYR